MISGPKSLQLTCYTRPTKTVLPMQLYDADKAAEFQLC